MKKYIEVKLFSHDDQHLDTLWTALYQQIHIGFVNIKNIDDTIPIGVSFPDYDAEKNHLGNRLRLFADDSSILKTLNIKKYLFHLMNYVHISSIKEVPAKIEIFALFKRQQVKSSITRIAKRKAKRKGIDFEKALASLGDFQEKYSKAPSVQIKSLSSRHKFNLFIVKQISEQKKGTFNCYGLSKQATVPIF